MDGTTNRSLVNQLGKSVPKSMKELMDVAQEEALGEESEIAMFSDDRANGKTLRRPRR